MGRRPSQQRLFGFATEVLSESGQYKCPNRCFRVPYIERTCCKDNTLSQCHYITHVSGAFFIAALDPVGRMQPRSRTTCVGWFARFNWIDAIHAVCFVPYHAVVQQEESSKKLEYQSSDSQEWPCPSSLGVSEAESPDWEKELSYMFF